MCGMSVVYLYGTGGSYHVASMVLVQRKVNIAEVEEGAKA